MFLGNSIGKNNGEQAWLQNSMVQLYQHLTHDYGEPGPFQIEI